jgi:hypothetical protein
MVKNTHANTVPDSRDTLANVAVAVSGFSLYAVPPNRLLRQMRDG